MVNTHFQDQGFSVKKFQSDNGGEFISKECQTFFAELGIVHRKIIPYQSEQNGMIERLNRTIIDCAESMRHSGKLEQRFWTAAVKTAVYIINRRPHSALPQRMSPFEAWNSERPEIGHLRTLGCDAYVHLPNQLHRKLQPRGRKVTFIGYPSDHKGYQFWDPEEERIIVTRFTDAIFDESSFTRTVPLTSIQTPHLSSMIWPQRPPSPRHIRLNLPNLSLRAHVFPLHHISFLYPNIYR